MTLFEGEYITIPNDPIVDQLEPIFDRKTANL